MIYEFILQKTIARVNEAIYRSLTLRHFVTDYNLFFRINFMKIKEILRRPNYTFYELVEKKKVEDLNNHVELNPNFKLSSLTDLITIKLFFDTIYSN